MSTNCHEKLSYDELDELNKEFDRQLKAIQKTAKTAKDTFSFKKTLFKILAAGLCLAAPFIVLVRISVYTYSNYQLNGWLALMAGVTATILLLMGYGLFLAIRYKKNNWINKQLTQGLVILVLTYTLYGLFYYSSLNTKTEEIRSYYRSLHPIIRVALSTTTLADNSLLVTDIRREPEDYVRMGLPENQFSLHYVQSNGYVHAVDLRTRDRAEWKNWLTGMTLNIIGLKSIRHEGTTDHLHVYLPLKNS